MGGLLGYQDDGDARCASCGALAVGPCARCEAPTCGDCCVLTEGGARTYAICPRCESSSGKSLRSPWLTVIGWFLLPIAVLAAAVFVMARLAGY